MAEEACCGCVALEDQNDYNLGLHIGTIFIMFAVSIAGTLVPLIAKRFQTDPDKSPLIMEVFFAFSFGIVLACGLIHMVNEGIERLKSECLGSITEEYGAWGLAVVLLTLVLMHFIECESSVYLMGKPTASTLGHFHPHGAHVDCDTDVITPDPTTVAAGTEAVETSYRSITAKTNEHEHEQNSKRVALRKKIAAVIFEAGVIFHSIIIGLDLGVTSGSEFTPLLIAICFHQFFEGIAIGGSTIRSIESRGRLMLMNLMFALTTPIGLAFGIAVRSTYSSTSITALWVNGILDCVAGGILVYNGLVELMTYTMTTNEKFLARPTRERFIIYGALWFGAGAMALIGKWA